MTKLGDVPCGACHACCKSELVVILPEEGDIVESYEHEIVELPGMGPYAHLKHKKNGECVYLDRQGRCSIHDRRPHMCQIFDCRAFYLSRSRKERQELTRGSPLARVIFKAGKDRVPSLDITELPKMRQHMEGKA